VRPLAFALAVICVGALAGCGNTLQDQPLPHNILEGLIRSPTPVYWLGASFHGLAVSEATHDPGGAFNLQYGDCREGGQVSCITRLRVVSSPNNSFVPAGTAPHVIRTLRGIRAAVALDGRTIEIPTGGVLVDIYASDPRLAAAAARAIVPINAAGAPGAQQPPPLPDTGFGTVPLPGQTHSRLRPLG
jgi:hypothetical protein